MSVADAPDGSCCVENVLLIYDKVIDRFIRGLTQQMLAVFAKNLNARDPEPIRMVNCRMKRGRIGSI